MSFVNSPIHKIFLSSIKSMRIFLNWKRRQKRLVRKSLLKSNFGGENEYKNIETETNHFGTGSAVLGIKLLWVDNLLVRFVNF